MSTNNISQKQILSYVVSTFRYWDITTVDQQVLKAAKKNKPEAIKPMKRTLLELMVLHMFDYKISSIQEYLPESNIVVILQDIKQDQMQQIILAYLSEFQCPLLLEMKNQKAEKSQNQRQGHYQEHEQRQIQHFVGCNLQSSRVLLILCAWVMGISNYFNHILPNVIQKRMTKLQNPEIIVKSAQNLIQRQASKLSKQPAKQQSDQVMTLFKSIKARLYQADCYKTKKIKLKTRVQAALQKMLNTQLPLEALFQGRSSQKQLRMEQQIEAILLNQIDNMKERKYFWIWVQEKILKEHQSEIKTNHEYLQMLQADQSTILYDAQVDLDYLAKYIELCEYYEQKYNQLQERLSSLKLNIKKSKQVQNQVLYEIKQTLNTKKNSINKKHLFIALQLKNHLNISLGNQKKKNSDQNENHQDPNIKAMQVNKRLKKQLKKYLSSIEDAIKFI